MSDLEKQDLTDLKRIIETELPQLEIQLMFFPLDESDEDFKFLVKKAASYRDMLKTINSQLNDLKP